MGKNMDEKNCWRKISKEISVNDEELGPWENAGMDDGIIKDFLKKRFLKEKTMMIVFQILVSVSCFVAVIELLMLSEDTLSAIVVLIIACITNYCLYNNLREKHQLNQIIQHQEYQLCDCTAFEITNNRNTKYCYVIDSQNHILQERNGDKEPVPMKVAYHGYFTDKDNEARLLRVNGIKKSMLYYVFPVFYLRNMDQRK